MKERRTPCEAIMLLVQRMESHPEEFRLDSGKWATLLMVIKKRVVDKDADALIILEDFEVEIAWRKFKSAGQKQLRAYVMKKIIEREGDKDDE